MSTKAKECVVSMNITENGNDEKDQYFEKTLKGHPSGNSMALLMNIVIHHFYSGFVSTKGNRKSKRRRKRCFRQYKCLYVSSAYCPGLQI